VRRWLFLKAYCAVAGKDYIPSVVIEIASFSGTPNGCKRSVESLHAGAHLLCVQLYGDKLSLAKMEIRGQEL